MKITYTYEPIKHDWWLCVDYRPVAQLCGPYELELLQAAFKAQIDLVAQTTVNTMLRLLEQDSGPRADSVNWKWKPGTELQMVRSESYAEMYSPEANAASELDNYVTEVGER